MVEPTESAYFQLEAILQKQYRRKPKSLNRVGIFFKIYSIFFTVKHLKIAFAIVFFCLMGGINAELVAQNKIKVSDGKIDVRTEYYKLVPKLSGPEIQTYVEIGKLGIYLFDKSLENGRVTLVWRLIFPSPAVSIRVLDNGNFVAYGENDQVVWETGTAGRGGSGTHLQIQHDGNLVLYNGSWYGGDGDALWASGTCGQKINGCGETGPR